MKLRYLLIAAPLLLYSCADRQKPKIDYTFKEGLLTITAKDNRALDSIILYDSRRADGVRSFPVSGKRAAISIDGLTNGFELISCKDKKGNIGYTPGVTFK